MINPPLEVPLPKPKPPNTQMYLLPPPPPLSSVPSPIPPTQKRKLPSTDAGSVPKKSTSGLGDLLEARGVRESALAIADSCETVRAQEQGRVEGGRTIERPGKTHGKGMVRR